MTDHRRIEGILIISLSLGMFLFFWLRMAGTDFGIPCDRFPDAPDIEYADAPPGHFGYRFIYRPRPPLCPPGYDPSSPSR